MFRSRLYLTMYLAHISPCGTMLVTLLSFGRLVIISNLHGVVKGEITLADAALEVNLNDSTMTPSLFALLRYSIYLAIGNGRIATATVSPTHSYPIQIKYFDVSGVVFLS